MTKLHKQSAAKPTYCRKKINMLFAGLGSVSMVRNCDLGLENAAFGLRLRAAFLKPVVTVFHHIWTSQPANNIYLFCFRLVSGWNSTNPAISMVPGDGGIFSYGALQGAEYVELIYFLERINGFCSIYTCIDD